MTETDNTDWRDRLESLVDTLDTTLRTHRPRGLDSGLEIAVVDADDRVHKIGLVWYTDRGHHMITYAEPRRAGPIAAPVDALEALLRLASADFMDPAALDALDAAQTRVVQYRTPRADRS